MATLQNSMVILTWLSQLHICTAKKRWLF